jgi:prepilin-type N-terminal cleavage/methylation domain-containing protein
MNNFILNKKIDTQSGFSLIEILVVLSFIGLFASLAFTYAFNARKEARDQARASTSEQLKLAFRLMKDDSATGAYPAYTAGVELGVGGAIDAQVKAFFPTFTPDPLNTSGTPNGAYGYWYDSNFRCIGNTQQRVVLTRVESPSNSNFTSVCTFTTNGNQNVPTNFGTGLQVFSAALKNQLYIVVIQ